MTITTLGRTAIGLGVLLAGGLAGPAQAQSETRTVQERVVVTLPSGKRIVRMVEKQVPVKAAETETAPSDPFAGPDGSDGSDDGSSGGGSESRDGDAPGGDIDPRILEWIGWYQKGDKRADANGDGRVTAADFNAYLMWLNDQDGDGNTGDGGDDNTGDGGDDNTGDGGDDNTGDGGDDNTGDGGDDNTGDGGDDNTGPTTETGWTDLSPSSDSMVLYVSEQGSDSNDGLSPERPLRTVSEGVSRLRDGYPDWLLLRRGDVFNDILSTNWKKSGRSESEKMVVGAYGEGPRPVLQTGTSKALSLFKRDRRAHVAFVSLELRPGVRYQNDGMKLVSPGVEDFLFEDLLISGYTHGIVLQGDTTGDMQDIEVRRCILIDNAGQTHSQGIFAHFVDGVLIEGCVIDRNGWDPARGRDDSATIFAHNVYIQRTVTGLVFRDNFFSRASSHGIQARLGGIVERNVSWANPIGILYGNEGARSDEPAVQGRVNDNVVIEGIHQAPDYPRGWGVHVQHADGVEVKRNIVANSTVGEEDGFGLMLFSFKHTDSRNLIVEDNVVDDYGRGVRVDEDDVISLTIRNNLISKSSGGRPLVKHDRGYDVSGLQYEGNRYFHDTQSDAFRVGNSQIDLTEWQADFDPQGGALLDEYVNGSATLDDYARSVGFGGVDELVEAMRSKRKGAWDERLSTTAIRSYFREAFTLRGDG